VSVIKFEPCARWVRVYFGGKLIASSKKVKLLWEGNQLPIYYFPSDDVNQEWLEHSTKGLDASSNKGQKILWNVRVGDKVAESAAFTYRNLPDGSADLGNHVAFSWSKMDSWFEEDEEVFVYPRDPYHRVDICRSSRNIRIEFEGKTLAETHRPSLLFETGLPTRYYIPRADVSMEFLIKSESVTQCPYKGIAHYFSVRIGAKTHPDLVWYYPFPVLECAKLEGLLAFLNEKVDVYEDAKLLEKSEDRP